MNQQWKPTRVLGHQVAAMPSDSDVGILEMRTHPTRANSPLLPLRWQQAVGYMIDGCLRASVAAMLAHAMLHPQDPRYAGKAIPLRNLIIVGSLTQAVPLLWLARRQRSRQPYPVWTDDLYLSIFWLDMFGNYANFYDRWTHFDLLPHFHGTGALAVVLRQLFGWPTARALVVTNSIHSLLEAQEYLTDVFAGTHNVRGWWDSAGDLSAGLLGTLIYTGMAALADERG